MAVTGRHRHDGRTPPGTATSAQADPQRTDIQGLRALAVGLVIVYHLLPNRLSGGFVGVDVFFVISGYLIIGTLHREVVRTGRLDLPAFYARRVRRLVPAATVVLVVTVALTVLLLPVSRWRPVSFDVVASGLQVQNWALAFGSTDYAAATQAVSPLQHYWSLAVEEQFYLVTPVVMVLAVALAARRARVPAARAAAGAVLLLGALSLAYSVLHSWSDPAQAYFVTTTRMWELVLGGALAMAPAGLRVPAAVRLTLGWTGLVLVLVAALTYTTASAFPGWIALVPTVGTALVLLSGSGAGGPVANGSVGALLSVRPATWVGDISYSLYLWHWPVLVFFLAASERQSPGRVGVLVVLVVSLSVAAASARTVENRFRHGQRRPPAAPGRPSLSSFRFQLPVFRLGILLVVVSLLAALGPYLYAQHRIANLASTGVLDADHPGALALDPADPRPVPSGAAVVPDPVVATSDLPVVNADGCIEKDVSTAEDPASTCVYGAPGAARRVVLVGDSHAAQYSTPLIEAAGQAGWSVQAMVRNGCPFTAIGPDSGGGPLAACSDQNLRLRDVILSERPDVVVTSALSERGYARDLGWTWSSPEEMARGYQQMWQPIVDAGIPLVVITDSPLPSPPSVPECVEQNGPGSGRCATDRTDGTGDGADPLVQAAEAVPGVRVVDVTTMVCAGDSCPAVVGNVLVYRDNHLTDTYARSLTGFLAAAVGVD